MTGIQRHRAEAAGRGSRQALHGERGTTLIELMVALLIGAILSIAVFSIMAVFEGRKRTAESGADLDATGSIAMFQLDQWIRSAGTGFVQANPYAYGCQLFASNASTQILPVSGTLPAPFGSVNPGAAGAFRLAPVVILPGQTTPAVSNAGGTAYTSDVLVIMATGNDDGEVPSLFNSSATTSQLNVVNAMAFTPADLVLLADQQPAVTGGVAPCMVTQIDSGFTQQSTLTPVVTAIPLSGPWYAGSIGTTSVSNFSSTAVAIDLGKSPTAAASATGQLPSFQVVGVGDNDTLYSYDLLNLTSATPQGMADGVFEMHALYGIDTTGDGKIDSWVKGDSTGGNYSYTTLMSGSLAAAGYLKNIRAIRVGLILRTALPERTAVNAATSLTLFSDLGAPLAYTRPLSATEQVYRYRTVEATIPLRNNAF